MRDADEQRSEPEVGAPDALRCASPKRILVVTLRYPPYVAGGYELLTRDAVVALRERGHRVSVLAGKGTRLESVDDVLPWLSPSLDGEQDLFRLSFEGSNLDRFAFHFLRMANYRATQRAIRALRPDVVFFFNLGLLSLGPVLAARHAGVPTLTYASDPWPANHWLEAWRTDPNQAKEGRFAQLERFWNVFRDLVGLGPVLTCSEYLRAHLVQRGLDPEATRVLHLGVPPDMERAARTPSSPSDVTRDPGASEDARGASRSGASLRLVCISSFWEGKGQDVLLRAAAGARKRGAHLDIVLAGAGGGDYRDRLEDLLESLHLAGSVRFEVAASRTEIARLLAGAQVLVVPSVWGEPFPLATLEGMVHGMAVVVSAAGGSPEAVRDGVDGLVVPAGDVLALEQALVTLAEQPQLVLELGRAARESARERLSHATFIDGLEHALARVLDPKRAGVPSNGPMESHA